MTGFYTSYYMDTLILITLTSVWLLGKATGGFFQERNPAHFSREITFVLILFLPSHCNTDLIPSVLLEEEMIFLCELFSLKYLLRLPLCQQTEKKLQRAEKQQNH